MKYANPNPNPNPNPGPNPETRYAPQRHRALVLVVTAASILLVPSLASADAEDCRRAAEALTGSEVSAQEAHPQAGQSTDLLTWKSLLGHRGSCRLDSNGRVFEVEIWTFPGGQAIGVAPSPVNQIVELECGRVGVRYQTCALPTPGKVELVRNTGAVPCQESRNWGVRSGEIWVDGGCRGRFRVDPSQELRTGRVSCQSNNGRRSVCRIPLNAEVALERRRSQAPCVEGTSWGRERELVWVDRGCRADFQVRGWVTVESTSSSSEADSESNSDPETGWTPRSDDFPG